MSSSAKLPTLEVRAELEDLIEHAEALAAGLSALAEEDRWIVWNLGGAAFGRSKHRGPGGLNAEQFALLAAALRDRLRLVDQSFTHRQARVERLRRNGAGR